MTTYTFLLCTEPYKFEATDTLLKLCEAIIEKGNTIKGIFTFGSGVYNIKKDISTGTSTRNLPEKLENFCQKYGITVAGCSTWVGLTGINEENFISAGKDEGLGELSNWSYESDKLIVFGAGG
ncbi:MAG: DsrE/DsrF/TusD sulfur relay family protein [Promethearchaeota archaeon]